MIAIMPTRLFDLLKSADSFERMLQPGEYLFHLGDPVNALHVVLDGEVQLFRFDRLGHSVALQKATSGDVVAEASLFAETYHCDAIASSSTTCRGIQCKLLRDRFHGDPEFAEAVATHLAQEVQSMRFRAEMLSLKTVAARLDAWEAWYGAIPQKGEWRRLADQLGVSPEAIYRELANRRLRS